MVHLCILEGSIQRHRSWRRPEKALQVLVIGEISAVVSNTTSLTLGYLVGLMIPVSLVLLRKMIAKIKNCQRFVKMSHMIPFLLTSLS